MPRSADPQPELALQGSLFGEPEPAEAAAEPASDAAGDLSDWTIATALFDLRKATLTVFAGNPRKKDVLATVALNGASA